MVGKIPSQCGIVLYVLGQFEVAFVENPISGDKILDPINEALTSIPGDGKGTFLFWYIGHGRGSAGPRPELELYHADSKDRGLPWSQINNLLAGHSDPHKAVVLNCCQAGLALQHVTPVSPKNIYLWPVCDEYDTTRVMRGEGGPIDCFTEHFSDVLLEGLPPDTGRTERDPLTLRTALEAAQDRFDKKSNKLSTGASEAFDRFACNLLRYDVLPPQIRRLVRRQILNGQRGDGSSEGPKGWIPAQES